MVGWFARFVFRRLRWLALASALRALARRSAGQSVDRAADELRHRLPEPVADALSTVPGDPIRLGGSALVTSRGARSVYRASRRAGGSASRLAQAVTFRARSVRSLRHELRAQIRAESDRERRRLWSAHLRAGGDHRAADEILLDVAEPVLDDGPLPEIPAPVPAGRMRRIHEPEPAVNRRLRTYRRPIKAWDRPIRLRSEPTNRSESAAPPDHER